MKKMEVDKLATQKTVLQVLDDFSGRWSNFKPVSAKVAQLRSLIQAVDADSKTQLTSTITGFTSQKKAAFTDMLDAAYKMAMKLKDRAAEDHDALLFDAVNYSHSTLESGRYASQLSRCQVILDKAMEHAGDMSDYHITAENLAAFKALVEAAAALSIDKDRAGTTHRMATTGIATQIKKADMVITGLDELIESFTSEADADFTATYFGTHASKKHHGGSKRKPADTTPVKQEAAA